MIIGIDATEFGIDRGGVRSYQLNLIRALQAIDKDNTYRIILHFWDRKMMPAYSELQSQITGRNFRLKWIRFPGRIISSCRLPIDIFAGSMDVYHGAGHYVDRLRHGKSVFTLHDLDYCMIQEMLNKEWVIKKDRLTRMSLQEASLVIVPSQFIKDALLSRYKVDKDRVFVIHHGVSDIFSTDISADRIEKVRAEYNVPEDYILFVGQANPNKNLTGLLESYKMLKRDYNIPQSLVLIGTRRSSSDTVQSYIEQHGLQKDVITLGFVKEIDLPVLYRGAVMFVLPSFYEGFGIPVLEAMASGVPVISSSCASLPEVVGDAGLLADPSKKDDLTEAMYRVLTDSRLKGDLVQKGLERVKQFTWEAAAKKTLNIYQMAAG